MDGRDKGVHVLADVDVPLHDVLERSVADAGREPNYCRQVADGPSTFEGNPWLNTTKHAAATKCVADVLTNSWALQTTTHIVWASTQWTKKSNTSENTLPTQTMVVDKLSQQPRLHVHGGPTKSTSQNRHGLCCTSVKSSSLTCQ